MTNEQTLAAARYILGSVRKGESLTRAEWRRILKTAWGVRKQGERTR